MSAGRKVSSRDRGGTQNIHKKDKSLSLSVSVVTKRKWRTQVLVKQSSQNKKAWCRVLNIEISDKKRFILVRIEQEDCQY